MIGQSIQTKVYFAGCVIRRHASFRTLMGELNKFVTAIQIWFC